MLLSVADMVRVVVAGGGLEFDSKGKSVDDMVKIAIAAHPIPARPVGPRVRIKCFNMSADDMVKIAVAGGGSVSFVLE